MMNALKRLLAANLSFFLFSAGHGISLILRYADWTADVLYPAYNRLMCWSVELEDWAGIKFLWGEAE